MSNYFYKAFYLKPFFYIYNETKEVFIFFSLYYKILFIPLDNFTFFFSIFNYKNKSLFPSNSFLIFDWTICLVFSSLISDATFRALLKAFSLKTSSP